MNRLLICLLMLSSLPAYAQIYRYTDANGNSVFTNQPPTDVPSQEVQLQQANRLPTNNAATPSTSNNAQAEDVLPPYSSLSLTGIPNDDAAIRANNGDFSVTVEIEPELAPGNSLRLLLDGQAYGADSKNTRFDLSNIDRGEHSLAVAVVDSNGNIIQQSAADTFTVQRISVHSPARAR